MKYDLFKSTSGTTEVTQRPVVGKKNTCHCGPQVLAILVFLHL